MKASKGKMFFACAGIIAALALAAWYLPSRTLSAEDLFDQNRKNKIVEIKFVGQQQTVLVTNETMISLIDAAFRQPPDRPVEAGQSYEVFVSFEGNQVVRVWVSIYPSLDAFAVSLPRFGLHDPKYQNVSFQSPVDSKLTNLFQTLYNGSKSQRMVNF